MVQRLQPWRSGRDEGQWLSVLIDTMENIARPEVRALPTDQFLLAAVRRNLRGRSRPILAARPPSASAINPIRRRS
jgi:hypothetical protein